MPNMGVGITFGERLIPDKAPFFLASDLNIISKLNQVICPSSCGRSIGVQNLFRPGQVPMTEGRSTRYLSLQLLKMNSMRFTPSDGARKTGSGIVNEKNLVGFSTVVFRRCASNSFAGYGRLTHPSGDKPC